MKIKVAVKGKIVLVETNPYKRIIEQEEMNDEQFNLHMEAVKQLSTAEPGWSGRVYEDQITDAER